MSMDFTPQQGDTSINIPITFDYKGGRGSNVKGNVIMAILIIAITNIIAFGVFLSDSIELYIRIPAFLAILYVGLFLLRFLVFKELWFSDIYEGLLESDFELKLGDIWQIFDIDFNYPYIAYFKNGYKGIFVRMEKDAITGKPDENMYDHYEAIGDAYNIAHSLNMNMIHIDYMDNVGNDSRMQKLYDDLTFVENPDMQEMLIDIYSNLQDEMSRNYASFDIYLYLTKDKTTNFIYNVQSVCNRMLGGNFITYKVLDRFEISRICVALFNLHDFSIVDACENVLQGEVSTGIIPISLTHSDGTVETFNKTVAEKELIARERARKNKEKQHEEEKAKAEAKRKRHEARRNKGKVKEEPKKVDNTVIDIFEVEEDLTDSPESINEKDEEKDIDIFNESETNSESSGVDTNSDDINDELNIF